MMKKNLILFAFLILAMLTSKAQIFYGDNKADALLSEQKKNIERQRIVNGKIKLMMIYKTEKGNPLVKTLSATMNYNEHGDEISNLSLCKNGRMKSLKMKHFNENGKCIESVEYGKRGRQESRYQYVYDTSGNLLEQKHFWRKPDNLTLHIINSYNKDNSITDSRYLFDNDKKLFERYEYLYNEDGSKKQTIQYNKKGKIEHKWNFNCNPAGEMESKMNLNDSSKICVRFEVDKQGNQLKIVEEYIKWKGMVRFVYKYNANGNLLELNGFDKKGNLKYRSTAEYNSSNLLSGYVEYKMHHPEKLMKVYQYKYDNANNLTEAVVLKDALLLEKYQYFYKQN